MLTRLISFWFNFKLSMRSFILVYPLLVGFLLIPKEGWGQKPLNSEPNSISSNQATITETHKLPEEIAVQIISGCGDDIRIEAQIFAESLSVTQLNQKNSSNPDLGPSERPQVNFIHLDSAKQAISDSLRALMKSVNGAMLLRCPGNNSQDCILTASYKKTQIQCANCSACEEDLDAISLKQYKHLKQMLQKLQLFL